MSVFDAREGYAAFAGPRASDQSLSQYRLLPVRLYDRIAP